MQRSATKCNVLLSTNEKAITKTDSVVIKNSQSDNQLSFEKHIKNVCGKTKAKFSTLSLVGPFMNFNLKNANECLF